jgi:flavodoxin
MKVVIVYDSVFGNTATVAREMAAALEAGNEVRLLSVTEAKRLTVVDVDLLLIGSPTRGFRPTPAIDEFAISVGPGAGRRAAVFDTRLDAEEIHPAPLRWVVAAGGYAAQRMAQDLERHGFKVDATAGFLVTGTEGPLKAGEIERAREWALSLAG